MLKSPLIPSLLLCGASLIVSVTVAGCGDDTTVVGPFVDEGVLHDLAVPVSHDMAHQPVDCGIPCGSGID